MKQLLVLSLALLASCAGARARDHVLMPLARQSWPDVRTDVERGVGDALAASEFTIADADAAIDEANWLEETLEAGQRLPLAGFDFEALLGPLAERGIQAQLAAGEVGPNGAEVLRRHLDLFRQTLSLIADRPTLVGTPADNPYVKKPVERRLEAKLR